jgi:hypothetical protein
MSEITFDDILNEFNSSESHMTDAAYNRLIELARGNYPEIANLTSKMILDSRSDWRIKGLQGILSQNEIEPNVLTNVQGLLLNDSNKSIRMAAADVLGRKSKWPDIALRKAVEYDENRSVKISSVRAILNLANVNFRAIDFEINRMKSGEIEPHFAEIERITQADADGEYKDLE